ncbi:MAG: hypothetical protein U1D55_15485 [Phycisphaerae bacterium]
MDSEPLAAVGDRYERGADGRFRPGNQFGRGNPHAQRVQELRSALLSALSDADLQAIVEALVESAKRGDVAAAKLLFERTLGRVPHELVGSFETGPFVKIIRGVPEDVFGPQSDS